MKKLWRAVLLSSVAAGLSGSALADGRARIYPDQPPAFYPSHPQSRHWHVPPPHSPDQRQYYPAQPYYPPSQPFYPAQPYAFPPPHPAYVMPWSEQRREWRERQERRQWREHEGRERGWHEHDEWREREWRREHRLDEHQQPRRWRD